MPVKSGMPKFTRDVSSSPNVLGYSAQRRRVLSSVSSSRLTDSWRAAVVWRADLIVMGKTDRRATGRPYVGSQTEHLLEFTRIPVVVVPDP